MLILKLAIKHFFRSKFRIINILFSIIIILIGCYYDYNELIIFLGSLIGMPITVLYLYCIITNDTEAFCEDKDGILHEPEYFLKK